MKYNKIIYIGHPYGGKEENKKILGNIICSLIKQYPKCLFLSGVHAFGFAYNSVDYDTGMDYCLWLLKQADEAWFYGDVESSRGCKREIQFCKDNAIPYCVSRR